MSVNIVLIGETTVGKTSFFNRIKHGPEWQLESHICTMCTELHSCYDQNGHIIRLYDTPGLTKFKAITMSYIKGTHVFILMYSIDDKRSFEKLSNWVEFIRRYQDQDQLPKYVLIANKTDLCLDNDNHDLIEKGKAYALEIDAVYYKISLKDGDHINHIILDNARHASEHASEISEPESGSCYDVCTIL